MAIADEQPKVEIEPIIKYLDASWEDADLRSIRKSKNKGLTRSEYLRLVENLTDKRDLEIRRIIDSLDPEERKWTVEILRDIRSSGETGVPQAYKHIWEMDYKWKPVSIEQYLDDDYYLGSQTKTQYPKWRDELCTIFAPGAQVYEWQLGGAIGGGKSWNAMLALTYQAYKMTCLISPQRYYGLAPKSLIAFGVYAVTREQVEDVGFDKVRMFVENCPYFLERLDTKIKGDEVLFKDMRVQIIAGSQTIHAIGRDVFSVAIDETNFMRKVSERNKNKDAKSQAQEMYDATRKRLVSRFMQTGGTVPGLMLLISSKTTQDAFMEIRKKEAIDSGEVAAGHTHITEFSQWEVRDRRMYSKPTFFVEVGDRMFASRVLEAKTPEKVKKEARGGATVIEVPGEFEALFSTDTEGSLRDIAGIATYGITPLIRELHRVQRCISDKIVHPFTRTTITLSDKDEILIDEYFVPDRLFKIKNSVYMPRRHPQMPRFIHVDIAFRGDALGIACGHVVGMKEVKQRRPDGTYYLDSAPMVEFDFFIRVVPPSHGSIDLSKIRSFIISLRDYGMPIGVVSFDGYESEDCCQILSKVGFETETVSVDRTDEAYLSIRQGILDERARFYEYDPFITELTHLERDLDKRKVDHPTKFPNGQPGSKDVSDCAAAVFHRCMYSPAAYTPLGNMDSGHNDSASPTVLDKIRRGSGFTWDAVERTLRKG